MFRWTSLDIVVALQASGQSGRMSPRVLLAAGRSRLHIVIIVISSSSEDLSTRFFK